MFKLLFISLLSFHIVKCDIYSLEIDACFNIPGVDEDDFNSILQTLSEMDKIVYVPKLNPDFDAEGTGVPQNVIFGITEDKKGLEKKRYLEQQLQYLRYIYRYLNLTEKNEEMITPDDSFNTVLTKLQKDFEVKLKYVQPFLKKVCGVLFNIMFTEYREHIKYTIPYEFTLHVRKILMFNIINETRKQMLIDKKLKVFETSDCELQKHVLPNIIEFFKTSDKIEWMRIASSLKAHIEQCEKNLEDIQEIISKIPSSSVKNLIFENTVCLRNIETNGYLISVNINNMSASTEKKFTYYSYNNTVIIQNPNGKYMQVLLNHFEDIVGSHRDSNLYAFWTIIPAEGDYVNLRNIKGQKYLYLNENQITEVNDYDDNTPVKYQWEVEVNC